MPCFGNLATFVAMLATVASAAPTKRASPYANGQNGCYYPAETLGSSGCLAQGVTEHGCPFFNNEFCDSKVTWIPDRPPTKPPAPAMILERRQYDPTGCVYNGPILGSMGCIRNGWTEHGCPDFAGQPECQRRVQWFPPGQGATPRPTPTYETFSNPGPATYAPPPPPPPPAGGTAVVTITTHSRIYDVQLTTQVITNSVVKSVTTTLTSVSHSTTVSTIHSLVFDIKSTTNLLTSWGTATSTKTIPTVQTLNAFSTHTVSTTKTSMSVVPATKFSTLYTTVAVQKPTTVTHTTMLTVNTTRTSMMVVPATKFSTLYTTVAVQKSATVTHTTMLTVNTTRTVTTTVTQNKVGPAVTNNVTVNKSVPVANTIFRTVTATPPAKTGIVSGNTSSATVLKNVPSATTKTTTARTRLVSRGDVGAFCKVAFRKVDGTRYWEGNACTISDTCIEVGTLEGRPIYRGLSCY